MKPILLAALVLFASSTAVGEEDMSAIVREILSTGTVQMSVLERGRDPRIVEIEERLLASLRAGGDWYNSYLQDNYNGTWQELPYHENLGVSEEEYEFYLAEYDDYQLRETDVLLLNIQEFENGYRITAPDNAVFGEVVIEMPSVRVVTQYGMIPECQREPSDQEGALMQWRGIGCVVATGPPMRDGSRRTGFLIGRVEPTGELLIQFVAREFKFGAPVVWEGLLLREVLAPTPTSQSDQ